MKLKSIVNYVIGFVGIIIVTYILYLAFLVSWTLFTIVMLALLGLTFGTWFYLRIKRQIQRSDNVPVDVLDDLSKVERLYQKHSGNVPVTQIFWALAKKKREAFVESNIEKKELPVMDMGNQEAPEVSRAYPEVIKKKKGLFRK